MPRAGVFTLGLLASSATAATLALHVFSAVSSSADLALQVASAVSAVLGGALLPMLVWLCWTHASQTPPFARAVRADCTFLLTVILSLAANLASVVALACLFLALYAERRKSLTARKDNGLPTGNGFLAGSCALVALSVLAQGVFLTLHRRLGRGEHVAFPEQRPGRRVLRCRLARTNFKAIRYSETIRHARRARESQDAEAWLHRKTSQTTLGSETSSVSHSLTAVSPNVLTPSSADKKRPLLPALSPHRGTSSDHFQSGHSLHEDGHSRGPAGNTTPPAKSRLQFLETIPASPTASLTSSHLADLPPPPPIPHSVTGPSRNSVSIRATSISVEEDDESNIHPLFRSDSPALAQVVTPGTCLVAPAGGVQIITPKSSYRSLRRQHSSSLSRIPSTARSVSQKCSFESSQSSPA